ncbi:MAG: nuclear transport factor 2 family protein [Actinobacteria bacterium]|nr:MAG: nuclear transport factor 2 family protein [Actinomycetota bacterium]
MADDSRSIENLLYTYAERIDAGDLEGVADLFAHGQITAQADTTTAQRFEGRDEVLGMYEAATRLYEDNGTPHTKHVTTNAIIDVDERAGTAVARSYYTVFQQTDALPLQPIIAGRYHDTFKRIDGAWWFDTRTMFVDLVGDLSHHLLYELR